MNTNINKICLAFLIALSELDTPLKQEQKQNLADIGEQLLKLPQAWESSKQLLLFKIIEANSQLNQRYHFYKSQLDATGEISHDLLPTDTEIKQLFPINSTSRIRGFIPEEKPSRYDDIQINNIVFVVSGSEKPEEAVKKLSFLDKIKQFLEYSNQ